VKRSPNEPSTILNLSRPCQKFADRQQRKRSVGKAGLCRNEEEKSAPPLTRLIAPSASMTTIGQPAQSFCGTCADIAGHARPWRRWMRVIMPTRNRLALQRILGNNPTNNCAAQPTNRIPARLLSDATRQRAQQTNDRYGNFLQFIANALRDVADLPTDKIRSVIGELANWLGKDDPLGLLHSLENGQLLTLLGEIAPVIAEWFSENLGLARGGRQSRRGGFGRVTTFAPSLSSVFSLGATLAPYLANYLTGPNVSGFSPLTGPPEYQQGPNFYGTPPSSFTTFSGPPPALTGSDSSTLEIPSRF
jgi:hypothetical protein